MLPPIMVLPRGYLLGALCDVLQCTFWGFWCNVKSVLPVSQQNQKYSLISCYKLQKAFWWYFLGDFWSLSWNGKSQMLSCKTHTNGNKNSMVWEHRGVLSVFCGCDPVGKETMHLPHPSGITSTLLQVFPLATMIHKHQNYLLLLSSTRLTLK